MAWSIRNNRGFTLIEALISTAILLVLVVGGLSANTLATTSVTLNENRSRANLLAQEGMDAIQGIRAGNFSGLTPGDFHPVNTVNGWTLAPGAEIIGKFTRVITISVVYRTIACATVICDIVKTGGVVDSNSWNVNSKVSWTEAGGAKEINLATLVTYWR